MVCLFMLAITRQNRVRLADALIILLVLKGEKASRDCHKVHIAQYLERVLAPSLYSEYRWPSTQLPRHETRKSNDE
jgi:hypothetical protein